MRIKLISPDAQRAEQLARLLGEADPSLEVQGITAPPQALAQALSGSRPPLVLVDGVDAPALQAVGRFTAEHPQIETLVLSADQSPGFLLQAMQAGVREVLPSGADALALRAAVQTSWEVLESATLTGAELLGEAGRLGVLAPGAAADLVLCRADPGADVRVLADPEQALALVVSRGRVVRDDR